MKRSGDLKDLSTAENIVLRTMVEKLINKLRNDKKIINFPVGEMNKTSRRINNISLNKH